MGAETIDTALGHQAAGKRAMKSDGTMNRAVRHTQGIHRRPAAADLLADVLLKIDDRAGLVHAIRLARHRAGGECSFHATSALSLRQTSSTLARELKAEMRKYPSPAEPKPEPGVMTTWASCSILSNMSHELRPAGQPTQT